MRHSGIVRRAYSGSYPMRAKHMAFLQMRSETGEGMGSRVCGDGTGGGLAEKRACFGVRADAVRLAGPPSC
jgi:hypothetical protein